MTTDPPCPRRDKWFRGCRFEPRYDLGTPKGITEDELYWFNRDQRVAAIRATASKTYVLDICLSCGKVVDRGGAR